MFAVDTSMFLTIPAEARERLLHPGKVSENNGEIFVAAFDEPLAPAVGSEANVFCEHRGKFYQQAASVVEIRQSEPTPVIVFHRVGQAVNAESRGAYRVCTISAGLTARLGPHRNCHVLDVNADGFAAIVPALLKKGVLLPLELTHQGKTLTATARLQAIKVLPDGRFRYGFLLLDKAGSPMRRELEKLTAGIQRDQLRRLAGAA